MRQSPGAGSGLGRKSCLTGRARQPFHSLPPSLPTLPARASLPVCAPHGLAMSQPGQKPAASPRPRRAAAARHTQEVSGT